MDRENRIYQQQGFGAQLGIKGQIGLLIVDFVNAFVDPLVFGGGNIADAAAETEPVLAHARKTGWAVAHSRIVFADDASDANVFSGKVPVLLSLTDRSFNSEIISGLSPADGELVVRKTLPSAFFGTGLAPWLTTRSVQTLLVAGETTSGYVRASVVDAMCHGFRPIVLSECVGDRSRAPHEASLFDMS